MELQEIVNRYAEAITELDPSLPSPGSNTRTGTPYRPGFKAYGETEALELITDYWARTYRTEHTRHNIGLPYPGLPRARIDHVLTGTGAGTSGWEWGIEAKRLQHVGDNGKTNGFAVPKMLSPYLADRGVLHDALRLREHGFTSRSAVVGWSFDYDDHIISELRRLHGGHPATALIVDEVERTTVRNGSRLYTAPLIEFADAIMSLRGLTRGPRAEARFEAWSHPAGGVGIVFGWEIRPTPERDPDYDPRHPW